MKISLVVDEKTDFQNIEIYEFFKFENQFYQKISNNHALKYTQIGLHGKDLSIGFGFFTKVTPIFISEIKFTTS